MQLPVCGMEQEIVEAINDNNVVIVCGETGSGKSTQVCLYLHCSSPSIIMMVMAVSLLDSAISL